MSDVYMDFTGTEDECSAFVEGACGAYAPEGYGTWFNWPPGRRWANGEPITRFAPKDHGDGTWTVYGSRYSSCD